MSGFRNVKGSAVRWSVDGLHRKPNRPHGSNSQDYQAVYEVRGCVRSRPCTRAEDVDDAAAVRALLRRITIVHSGGYDIAPRPIRYVRPAQQLRWLYLKLARALALGMAVTAAAWRRGARAIAYFRSYGAGAGQFIIKFCGVLAAHAALASRLRLAAAPAQRVEARCAQRLAARSAKGQETPDDHAGTHAREADDRECDHRRPAVKEGRIEHLLEFPEKVIAGDDDARHKPPSR